MAPAGHGAEEATRTETITLGVEEEFLVVDRESGDLIPGADRLLPSAREELGGAVASELNLCQIEVATPVCTTLAEVRSELVRLRRGLGVAAARIDAGVAAVGTHPFGRWQDQKVDTDTERYRRMDDAYRIVARQQVICGCHVHVGIADPELAVAAMNRARPWLAVLLALSANSPFWQGMDTGYASYRLQIWHRWPTSGMPPRLGSASEFDDVVEELQAIDAIEDPTFLYWYVRPSSRYPTLEFRACDVCLVVDDTVAIAGLVRALAWTCLREVLEDAPEHSPRPEVMEAAMWRAARYGLSGQLVSPTEMVTRRANDVVGELLAHVRDGLDFHDDWLEVSNLVAALLASGDGATRQRAAFARRGDPYDVIRYATDATVGTVDDRFQ